MRKEQNIAVVPMDSFLMDPFGGATHRGGPLWSDWSQSNNARFRRNGKPIDEAPKISSNNTNTRYECGVWIGPICWHFGHFIAEIASRIPYSIKSEPNKPLIFSADFTKKINLDYRKRSLPLMLTPDFVKKTVEWFGGRAGDIVTVNCQSIFDELIVFPQAEQLGDDQNCGPTDEHIDFLTENAQKIKTKNNKGTLFVSRVNAKRSIAGERYIESVFRAAGVDVIYPESMSLEDQLRAYMSYETLIFPEGSALHGVQLLGRIPGRVILVRRRHRNPFGKYIQPRTTSFNEISAVSQQVFGCWPSGRPDLANAMTIIDSGRFLMQMKELGINLEEHWDNRVMNREARSDLVMWLKNTGFRVGGVSAASAGSVAWTSAKGLLRLSTKSFGR